MVFIINFGIKNSKNSVNEVTSIYLILFSLFECCRNSWGLSYNKGIFAKYLILLGYKTVLKLIYSGECLIIRIMLLLVLINERLLFEKISSLPIFKKTF